MATKTTKRTTITPRRPERKWGPFHGGVGVAVWLNEVDTDAGKRYFRTLTIAPRRYLDSKTGRWENASSLRTTDIPSLVLALEAAHEFMSNTPLPGLPADSEEPVDPHADANGEVAE